LPLAWYHRGEKQGNPCLDRLLEIPFEFAFFVGFGNRPFWRQVTDRVPSFCLTDVHPHPDVPEGVFRGVLAHHAAAARADILLCGGSYNSGIFFKNRTAEDLVVCVGRLHPDKNQIELIDRYCTRIYRRWGLPLWLVGGVDDPAYYARLRPYVDGISVCSTVDRASAEFSDGFRPPAEIAALLNRARFFVSASPKESFGIALAEALACGATCVLNGDFRGFDAADLAPYVYGSISSKQGSILDWLEQAFLDDIHRDGSDWVRKYSTERAAVRQLDFIQTRLRET
jgi:glycosyltransferase involved in cell wall biosynthesis